MISITWPIIGTWTLEGHSEATPGVLFKEGETVYLKLFLEIPGPPSPGTPHTLDSHQCLAPFRPPRQPTICGETKSAGHVTLFNCLQCKSENTFRLDPPTSRIELTLHVQQVWVGDAFVGRDVMYNVLSFSAPGLHSVLSASRLEQKWLEYESDTNELKRLTGAEHAFLFHRGQEPRAEISVAGRQYTIVFSTIIGVEGSNTEGDVIRTTDVVRIETSGATIAQLMPIAYQIEQFLSLLCVGPFRGDSFNISCASSRTARFVMLP
jgi:hypothetical protein